MLLVTAFHPWTRREEPRRPSKALHHPLRAAAIFLFLSAVTSGLIGATTNVEEILPQVAELIQTQQLPEAEKLLAQTLLQVPNDPRLHNFQGVVYAQQGDFRAAEEAFRAAIAIAPQFAGAHLNLARLYQERSIVDPKAADQALETFQSLLGFAPQDEQANYQVAFLLLGKGDFATSLHHLARLPASARLRSMVQAMQCAALSGTRNLAEATKVCGQLAANPEFSEIDVVSILSSLAGTFPDLAIELLEELKKADKAAPETLDRLAAVYRQQGNLAKARSTLEHAFRLRPAAAGPLVELAQLAYDQKDLEGSLGYLAHARDLDPENPGIHFFFGMVCVDLDLPADAKESLRKAVDLAPDRPYSNYALGAVLLTDHDFAGAIAAFEKFAELRPGDPRGPLSLGLAHYEAKRFDEARAQLKKAAGHRETASGANYYLGRIAAQEHRNAAAIQYYEHAIEANPGYADAYADMGLAYSRLRDFEAAGKAVHHAVELEPEGYLANLNLLVFYQRTKDGRTEAQQQKFDQIKQLRAEQAKMLLRRVEVQPRE